MLKFLSETDAVLYEHVYTPQARNITYLSPRSQNEVINIIGCDMIRAEIIKKVKRARFYSILADEVSSHNEEYLPLCIRFVDDNNDIQEAFIAFLKLKRVRACDIKEAIVTTLEELGLSVGVLRGQGYDGAANMAGARSGVQKLIRDTEPKAVYTHCAGHSLNLVVMKSCSITPIRNCIDNIKSFTLWIKYSPKREGLLKKICSSGSQGISSRSPILNVCITRWIENIDGWERFCLCHPFMVQMCEFILYGTTEAGFEVFKDGWTAEDKRNALAHLKALESFEFIYTLTTLQRSLFYLKEPLVKLQGKKEDIVSGLAAIDRCCSELRQLRSNIASFTTRIYAHSCRIAEKSGITVAMPRTCSWQTHRFNPPSSSVEDYFKNTVAIPFLDHLIQDLSERFDSHSKTVALLQGLLPKNINTDTSFQDVEEAVLFYKDDLPKLYYNG